MGKMDFSVDVGLPPVTEQEKELIERWKKKIASAEKRHKDFWELAKNATSIYEAGKKTKHAFNVLYANTETISPYLYSASPTVFCRPRNTEADNPLAVAASAVLQKALTFLIDPNTPAIPSFDDAILYDVLSALVPGRGVSWVRYDAVLTPAKSAEADDSEVTEGQEPVEEPGTEEKEEVSYETTYLESVPYDRFLCGYAESWNKVPWIGRIYFMTRAELVENFGNVAKDVPLDYSENAGGADSADSAPKDSEGESFAKVYQIWDKGTKRVYMLTMASTRMLKVVEDPLELEGFFPVPEPLSFMRKLTTIVPTPLYEQYREQAEELNRISTRINKLVSALKVRGFYDDQIQGIDQVLTADDNTFIAAQNIAALQTGGIDRALWLVPIERIIPVLQQLYVQREQTKQIIYEIMGISDVLRGAVRASESATATSTKAESGSRRLQKMQGYTAQYVCRQLRIMAEIIASHFSIETLQQMTELPYPRAGEKQQALMAVQQAQQQAQLAQAMGQQPPAPLGDEILQTAQAVSWEEIKQFMEQDPARNFAIDLETDSTIATDKQAEQEQVTETLNSLAQFGNAVTPLLQTGLLQPESAKAIMLSLSKKLRLGREVDEALRAQPAPQPEQAKEDPAVAAKAAAAEQKAASDKQIADIKAQGEQMKLEALRETLALKKQVEEMKAQHEMESQQREAERQQWQQQMERVNQMLAQQHTQAMNEGALEQQAIGGSDAAV